MATARKIQDLQYKEDVKKEQPQIINPDNHIEKIDPVLENSVEEIKAPGEGWQSSERPVDQWLTGQAQSGKGLPKGDQTHGKKEDDPKSSTTYQYGNQQGKSKGYGKEGDYPKVASESKIDEPKQNKDLDAKRDDPAQSIR
jgi:hypothetical protein